MPRRRAGLTPRAVPVCPLAKTGNGLVFTDNTAGAESFAIANANQSLAGHATWASLSTPGATDVITGTDEATVRVENAFTHLMNLRDALGQ